LQATEKIYCKFRAITFSPC